MQKKLKPTSKSSRVYIFLYYFKKFNEKKLYKFINLKKMVKLLTISTGNSYKMVPTIINSLLFVLFASVSGDQQNDHLTNTSLISNTLNDANNGFYTDDSLSRRTTIKNLSSKVRTFLSFYLLRLNI